MRTNLNIRIKSKCTEWKFLNAILLLSKPSFLVRMISLFGCFTVGQLISVITVITCYLIMTIINVIFR